MNLKYRMAWIFMLLISVSFCHQNKPETFVNKAEKTDENTNFLMSLADGWHIKSTRECPKDVDIISSKDYQIDNWFQAKVPQTVLAALVANGVYKDPYYDKNLEKIPTDIFLDSWYYRKFFDLDDMAKFKSVTLLFEGINYRANIWLNGQQIGRKEEVFGSFRMFEFNITQKVKNKANVLLVEVFPPQPGDFTIGFVDWNPTPPDKSMGLWRGVKIRLAGPVSLKDVFVQSHIDINNLKKADLNISARLINNLASAVNVTVGGSINGNSFAESVLLRGAEQKDVVFTAEEFPALSIMNPRLWWPNNMGKAELYQLEMVAKVDQKISDQQQIHFGIRHIEDYINKNGHRGYKINGQKILIRGGGWVDDLMLVESSKKLEAQFKYVRHMNLNAIRLEGFWGSSQELYDLADRYGILIMAGWSCQWEWEDYLGKPCDDFGGIQTPEEMELAVASLHDQIVWLRNHPSVFLWVLGSDSLPRPALEKKYYEMLGKTDKTRPILTSSKYKVSEISGPSAVKMNGPYDYVTPNYWYEDTQFGGAFGFNTETGPGPQPPPLASFQRMIPVEKLWPINDSWDFHCGRREFNNLNVFLKAFYSRYGKVKSVEEFAQKSQLANYEAIRAMFEAFGSQKHSATGIIQWMLNSAWPDMFWQLYDYFLMPSGAFYGTQKGCQPLNVVYNYGTGSLHTVNDTLTDMKEMSMQIRVFNLKSQKIFEKILKLDCLANKSDKVFGLPEFGEKCPVYFLDLKLFDVNNLLKAENFYWLSAKKDVLDIVNTQWHYTPNKSYADFTPLWLLEKTHLESECQFTQDGEMYICSLKLKNNTPVIAFFVELNIVKSLSKQPVLPVFWDNNYVSLLPGEEKQIKASFAVEDLAGEKPLFLYSGINIDRQK